MPWKGAPCPVDSIEFVPNVWAELRALIGGDWVWEPISCDPFLIEYLAKVQGFGGLSTGDSFEVLAEPVYYNRGCSHTLLCLSAVP